jgi:hypothetical protein
LVSGVVSVIGDLPFGRWCFRLGAILIDTEAEFCRCRIHQHL